jgi:hypothetical protein
MPEPSFLPDEKTLLSFVIWNSLRTKSVGSNKVVGRTCFGLTSKSQLTGKPKLSTLWNVR